MACKVNLQVLLAYANLAAKPQRLRQGEKRGQWKGAFGAPRNALALQRRPVW